MDEGYNPIVLDLEYKFGACIFSILHPLGYSCLVLFIIFHNTYTHVKDKKK
jgi:hypothetical protein